MYDFGFHHNISDFGCTISDLKAGESAGKSEIVHPKSEILIVIRHIHLYLLQLIKVIDRSFEISREG